MYHIQLTNNPNLLIVDAHTFEAEPHGTTFYRIDGEPRAVLFVKAEAIDLIAEPDILTIQKPEQLKAVVDSLNKLNELNAKVVESVNDIKY